MEQPVKPNCIILAVFRAFPTATFTVLENGPVLLKTVAHFAPVDKLMAKLVWHQTNTPAGK